MNWLAIECPLENFSRFFFLHNFHALFHARLNYLKSERERNEEEGENEHIKMSCWIIKNTRINFSSHRQHSFILFFVYKSHTISFSFKISRLPLGPFPLLCRKISQWTGKLRKKKKSALIINSHIYASRQLMQLTMIHSLTYERGKK